MALTDQEFTKCAGCEVDFPANTPSDKFCGECHDRLCIVCHDAVPSELKYKVCDDCSEKFCPRCGEPTGGAMCGDCDGGSERDPAVGEAWSGGFCDNH